MLLLACLASAALLQGSGAEPPVVLELRSSDAQLPGRGPVRRLGFTSDFTGTLFVWALSLDMDALVLLEDARGRVLAQDEDSGGGTTPCAELAVERGLELRIAVASATPIARGHVELHVVRAPTPVEARFAARIALGRLDEVQALAGRGQLEDARARLDRALEEVLATVPSDAGVEIDQILWQMGLVAWELEAFGTAAAALERVCAFRQRILPPAHPELLRALQNLGVALARLGQLEDARALAERVLGARRATLRDAHPDVLRARSNLAETLAALGDFAAAREQEQALVDALADTLDADHPGLLAARATLARTLAALGELASARELFEQVLAARARSLAASDPELLRTRVELAALEARAGELAAARARLEQAIAGADLPERHPELERARARLALLMAELDDLAGARALFEGLVDRLAAALPPGHPDLMGALSGLAGTFYREGDLLAARELFARAHAGFAASLPDDHIELQRARETLAILQVELGELEPARELLAKLLAIHEQKLPPAHPIVLRARAHLARCAAALGELVRARELQESVLAARSEALGADHAETLDAKVELAGTLLRAGAPDAARLLLESALAALARGAAPEGLEAARVRLDLARCLAAEGDLAGARVSEEEALRALARRLPDGHPELLEARRRLCATLARQGDTRALSAALTPLVAGLRARLLDALAGSPAEAELDALEAEPLVAGVLAAAALEQDGERRAARDAEAFLVAGLARAAGGLAARAEAGGARLCAARAALLDARGLALRPLEGAARAEADLAHERARAELAAALAQADLAPPRPDALCAGLAPDEALLVYRAYEPWDGSGAARLLVFVLRRGAPLARVELGQLGPVRAAIEGWRAAALASADDAALSAGERLRALVLDPLAARLDGVTRARVVADDWLALVPLEVLPDPSGALVGERLALVASPSVVALGQLRAATDAAAGVCWLALGGVDLAAAPAPGATAPARGAPLYALQGNALASAPDGRAELAAAALREAYGADARSILLSGASARVEALFALAPQATILRIEAPLFTAPATLPSAGDGICAEPWLRLGSGLGRATRGLSALALTGVALSGAGAAPGSDGRVRAAPTAEELAELELARCELVLFAQAFDAPRTARAAQGLCALRTALHAAGAGAVTLPLWPSDSARALELERELYGALARGVPAARALFAARLALRDAGAPLRDWAGWSLSAL